MTTNSAVNVTFSAPTSHINAALWERLYKLKLNVSKLDDANIPCTLRYCPKSDSATAPYLLHGDSIAYPGEDADYSKGNIRLRGVLKNYNTMQEFKDCDKKKIILDLTCDIVNHVVSKAAIDDPSLLYPFILLSYADLKSYRFTYWFCLPCILPSVSYTHHVPPVQLKEISEHSLILNAVYSYCQNLLSLLFYVWKNPSNNLWCASTLKESWENIYNNDGMVVIIDNGSDGSFTWLLRNLLILLSYHAPSTVPVNIRVITLRNPMLYTIVDTNELIAHDCSIMMQVPITAQQYPFTLGSQTILSEPAINYVKGYESNERGKPGPRSVDLQSILDSTMLMSQAVNLNLSLMKWRLWSELKLDMLGKTRCLLIGAGTLGCAVARVLIGWGITNITFIDNGTVSYSNPVRQCLYEYEDCVRKEYKAIAAANALKRIYPNIDSNGVVMTIPMPGHPLSAADIEDHGEFGGTLITKLDYLIKSHDVCYLLTDSREARWLPTLLCALYDKLLINVALGFDSYLVMRHGHGIDAVTRAEGTRLGCYYCSDIVAATNSQRDRSLDQQCTVTRPGLSYIAAGLAVELMVATLHSPLYNQHPGPKLFQEIDEQLLIPHQIRGSLMGFNQILPSIPAFSCCTACSVPVVNSYKNNDGTNFVNNVCNDSHILEVISGVEAMTSNIDIDDCLLEDDEM